MVPVPTPPPAAAPPVVAPALDQARGVDAEIRAAMFDLVSDRPLTALSRLEWLASPANKMSAAAGAGQRTREDVLFLLAQSYFRLGLSQSFRTTSAQLLKLAPAGRYVPMIQMQLMVNAYRRGDYAGARALAAKTEGAPDGALFDFVDGLSAYQMGDFQAAHVSFAKVSGGGNAAYAPYAKYMDVLASIQKDTARVAAAVDALGTLPSGNSMFADQVRLAAAQIAFRSGRFDAAAQYRAGARHERARRGCAAGARLVALPCRPPRLRGRALRRLRDPLAAPAGTR